MTPLRAIATLVLMLTTAALAAAPVAANTHGSCYPGCLTGPLQVSFVVVAAVVGFLAFVGFFMVLRRRGRRG